MIIIVGAGLSGLLTANLLQKEGISFKILEARNRVGGRINTIYRTGEAPLEMGATWFTKDHFNLIKLIEELNIKYFEQFTESRVHYQPSSTFPAQIVEIPNNSTSYRISGGTSNLINTLVQNLESKDILLNQVVTQITFNENSILVKAEKDFEANKVILALPPKLWANHVKFEPELPENLMKIARQTQTWMEDSIKVALTFTKPFWEEQNLPRTLFSNVGPVTELYDHCDFKNSKFALCGFINSSFKQFSAEERKELVINQLKTIFGIRISEFLHYEECVWSEEQETFQDSKSDLFPHQNNGNPVFSNSLFDDRLIISSTESASNFPGYMEGAVLSGMKAAKKIIEAEKK